MEGVVAEADGGDASESSSSSSSSSDDDHGPQEDAPGDEAGPSEPKPEPVDDPLEKTEEAFLDDPLEKIGEAFRKMHEERHGPRPEKWAACVPWPIPSHWNLDPDAEVYLPLAKPFLRPDGTPHPDILRIDEANSTLVRGRFIRNNARSARVPDVASDDWFSLGSLRKYWRTN